MRRWSFALLFLLSLPLFAQQWEQLPLYGGKVHFFVRNRFKDGEIYGVVKDGGVFRSTDDGLTWVSILRPDAWDRNAYTLDFDVLSDGTLLIIAPLRNRMPGLWKSTDDGATWVEVLTPPSGTLNEAARIDVLSDTTILVFAGYKLFATNNALDSWREYSFPSYGAMSMIADSKSPNRVLAIAGYYDRVVISDDYAKSWRGSQPIPRCQGIASICAVGSTGSQTIYGMWAAVQNDSGMSEYQYFTSEDWGETWIRKNVDTIFTDGTGITTHDELIRTPDGTLMMSREKVLFVSRDSGRHWERNTILKPMCLISTSRGTLASVALHTFRESTDAGKTWTALAIQPKVYAFSTMIVGALSPDTLFAFGKDENIAGVFESTDNGNSWKLVFEGDGCEEFGVTRMPELTWYIVRYHKFIMRGRSGQLLPTIVIKGQSQDTLRFDFQLNALAPGWLYAYAYQVDKLFISSDGGMHWEGNPFYYPTAASFYWYTSPSDPLVILNNVHSNDDDDVPYRIHHTKDGGKTWSGLIDKYVEPPIRFLQNNILHHKEFWFSSDFGASWYVIKTGIDTSFLKQEFLSTTTRGSVMLSCDSAWYLYNNAGSWERLTSSTGEPFKGIYRDGIEICEPYIFLSRYNRGVYRTMFSRQIVGINTTPEHTDFSLTQNYPNPATGTTRIDYCIPQYQHATLRIVSALGQIIWEKSISGEASTVIWDGRDVTGNPAPAGVYFYSLISGANVLTQKLCIVR